MKLLLFTLLFNTQGYTIVDSDKDHESSKHLYHVIESNNKSLDYVTLKQAKQFINNN